MSEKDNRKTAIAFFENVLSPDRSAQAFTLMADDATWTIIGKPELTSAAGTKNKTENIEAMKGIGMAFPKGLRMTIKATTAEGDRVALEAESYGETSSGKIYNNLYHILVEFRDGKILAIREYCDTLHIKDALGL